MILMTVWSNWEDYLAGMYANASIRPSIVLLSQELLSDPDTFQEAGREMIRMWQRAAQHNLGYLPSSRRAWVGWATCCYVHGATSQETRLAWGRMSLNCQQHANAVANGLILEYERGWLREQTLFEH